MNTIKTIVVTATLLAVGYGAHIVLKQQPISDRFATAEGVWQDLQASTPPADLDAANASRPQITLPEMAQTPLDSIRSNATQQPAGSTEAGTPALLPPVDGGPSIALDRPGEPLQSQSLAELRRQPSGTFSVANDGPAMIPVVPAQPTAPPPVQTANLTVPVPTPTAESNLAQPAAPTENRQASAEEPLAGYVAAGVLAEASAQPQVANAFEQSWTTAQAMLSSGQYANTLSLLSAHYRDQQLSDAQRDRLVALLDQLAGSVIYSANVHFESPQMVQPGQTLAAIAADHGVTTTFLARVNGLSPSAVPAPGTRVKVIRGPFRAEVSLADRELTVFLRNHYAGRFSCAIGRDLPAQLQEMTVVRVAAARPYVDFRTGEQIAAGAAENPYGNHWIELSATSLPGTSGLGIHSFGTAIDASDTRGCISVSPEEAADLAVILSPGSRVTVVP